MSDGTKIAWTDATWNPVRGCTKLSAGCKNCYAEMFAERWRGIAGHPFEQGFEVRLVPEKLGEPLRWKKPRRVFVNSMSDLFHEAVPFEFIGKVFGVMASCRQHTFQVLTKRPARMREFFTWLEARGRAAGTVFPSDGVEWRMLQCLRALALNAGPCDIGEHWPLPNVWLGVTVEDQRAADERIPLLLQTPAAVRFLSCEPLLEAVDLERAFSVYDRNGEPSGPRCNKDGSPAVGWVIIGGESGPKARPCNTTWMRAIVGQCREAGVPVFVKQLGASPRWLPPNSTNCEGEEERMRLKDRAGRDPAEWPEDLRVQEFPEVRP